MRVLAVTPLYPPGSLVGAWITTHEYLAHLAGLGHHVDVVPRNGPDDPYLLDGVHVHTPDLDNIDRLMPDADVVVSHLGDDQRPAEWAARHAKPIVRMVHGHVPRGAGRLDAHGGAALAVFASQALADEVCWGGQSVVCHPPIALDRYRTTPGRLVTLVNVSELKGGRMLWALARAEPTRRFLGVRGAYGTQIDDGCRNVDLIDTTPDMVRDVYARTRVLLMPSVTESWGRTALEAAASGIPTIGHPSPGLVECLGDAGIWADRREPRDWQRALAMLDDPDRYAEASARASARAAAFDRIAQLDRFATAVEAVA